MSDYTAIVARLQNVRTAPGFDRLNLAATAGHTVLVGKQYNENDLGLFFPAGGQLSEAFAKDNDLIKRRDENGQPAGGMFEENRRVRAIRMKGIESEGFWFPLASDTKLVEGTEVTHLGKMLICNRYETPAQVQARVNSSSASSQVAEPKWFKEHTSKKLKYDAHLIQPGANIYISEKLHGTSGRTYYGPTPKPTRWQKFLHRWLRRPLPNRLITASRRVVKLDWADQPYRAVISKRFEGKLTTGLALYYEIVGYYGENQPIQKGAFEKKSPQAKQYGESFHYSYGQNNGTYDIYLYAATQNGKQVDFYTLCEIALDLGAKLPPTLGKVAQYDGNLESLQEALKHYESGTSTLTEKHPREGVVLRIENPDGTIYFLKHHNFDFLLSEGKVRDSADFVDVEEVA